MAEELQNVLYVRMLGGFAMRWNGDEFMLYCPQGVDPDALLRILMTDLDDGASRMRVRFRMGIQTDDGSDLEIERRFDRAKQAADTLRNNYSTVVARYDNALHERDLLSERLTSEFTAALEQGSSRSFTSRNTTFAAISPF